MSETNRSTAPDTPIPAPLPPAVPLLCAWYRRVARPLPWRETPDPYRVWISEIMLQQTRIEAVIPYFARFLETFPTVHALAEADEDLLLKCWEGLGYYSRARNLKRAAREIVSKHGGILPPDPAALRALPGIGDYTAGAIASIAYGLPAPAVDGNVLRVVCRLVALREDVMLPGTRKKVTAWLEAVYPKAPADAAALTEGLMELGETLCIPNGDPLCDACPLREVCESRKQNLTNEIPLRSRPKARTRQNRTVLLLLHDGKLALCKRPARGLLAGMWELPSVEGELTEAEAAAACAPLIPTELRRGPDAKHIFSHLEWHMRSYLLRCDGGDPGALPYRFASMSELRESYALPGAFRTFLQFLQEL